MTEFQKPLIRRTRTPFARYGADQKKIVVTLHTLGADDAISLRLERRRQPFTILVSDLYSYMVRQSVVCAQMKKLRECIGKRRRKVRRK